MTDEVINRSADILGGTPVFSGTRVPVRILIEYLEAGDRLDDFLDNFPTYERSYSAVIPCHPRESGEQAGIHFNHESLRTACAGMTRMGGTPAPTPGRASHKIRANLQE